MTSPYEEIISLLETNNVGYRETRHAPVYTVEQAAKATGVRPSQIAKSLLLKCGSGFILAVLPGDKRLSSTKLKSLLKTGEFHFANAEEVKSQMGCEIGACYPFGNLIGLPVYADNSLSKNEVIFCNPGSHDRTIELRWRDFYTLVKPKIVNISEK